MSNSLLHGEVLVTDHLNVGNHLALVIDEDRDRLKSMKRTFSSGAPENTVFLVDASEGRALITSVDEILSLHRGPGKVVVFLRADPASWTTAAVLAGIRHHARFERVDVVVVAAGTPDTLPVQITDFPGLRMVPPGRHSCDLVVRFLEAHLNDSAGTERGRTRAIDHTR
ncbi:hypothetical protein RHA1_ro00758 [Rhodococcus jostii RHA1]|uniref:Uncharacterized protein n=1 Tax=Rhodococcus jostii (strain RHA1) TaxID=101510 RepID=Q0SIP3_RHOJR|nr:hypothetical protein RHA1_ro00758 [Rhodococcus jostii RHA1]